MQPQKSGQNQFELFQARLEQIINLDHPLVKLSKEFGWEYLEKEFGKLYRQDFGRPALPTRLMVGLHYLKYAFNESDESVVERFLENPYWQYFCGFDYFQHELPLDPTSLVKWRNRIGKSGAEKLLQETIKTAQRKKLIDRREMRKVNVDTTVQEKAVAFPTDAKLYYKAREMLVKESQNRGIILRQNYNRVGKRALIMQSRYRHARQMKRARRELRKLKNYLGRVIRDIRRKCSDIDELLEENLLIAERIYSQKRNDKNKIYSIHAPEVECISKGKRHKKYEFGCKVSIVTTSRRNWVIGVDALHGNPYDGHTLKGALEQAERLTGMECEEAYCDRGYRGSTKVVQGRKIQIVGRRLRTISRTEMRWRSRRSAIEPVIGHMKSDNRMGRNYLMGEAGDRINAILAGCGFNIRKLIRAFLYFVFGMRYLCGASDEIRKGYISAVA